MKKMFVSIFLLAILLVGSVSALTVTKSGKNYTATFGNGRVCTATSLVWDNPNKQITVTVTCNDGRGLRMIDMIELWIYLQGQVGRANQIDKFKITIN